MFYGGGSVCDLELCFNFMEVKLKSSVYQGNLEDDVIRAVHLLKLSMLSNGGNSDAKNTFQLQIDLK